MVKQTGIPILCIMVVLIFVGNVFAEDYTLILEWGGYGTGDGQFRYPNGVCIDNQGYVYVADGGYNSTSNHRVQKFLSDGTFVTKWGSQGSGNGQFQNRVMGITTDNQYLYVVDHDNDRIQKFTLDGDYVSQWGSYGSGNGQFRSAHGIAMDPAYSLYVVDDVNHRVQKFTLDGTYLDQWNCGNSPRQPACDADGYVYITDHFDHVVRKYDTDGNFITSWGGYGTGNGQFSYPSGIACDNLGYVYVCDQHNARIQKFTSGGTFVTKWDSYGWYLTVDNQGYVYVSGDNHKVHKYGADANQPPVAVIDSIYPYAVALGEDVAFGGHGEDPDGDPIIAWHWKINGITASEEASFITNTLPEGEYNVTFEVQDANGAWSTPDSEDIIIVDGMAFVPPYTDCKSIERIWGPPIINEAITSCNANSGEVATYAYAGLGIARAATGTGIYFEINSPTILQVEAELRSYGGKFGLPPGAAGSILGFNHMELEDDEWILKDSYFRYIDEPLDFEWAVNVVLSMWSPWLFNLFNQTVNNIRQLITLMGQIEEWNQLAHGLDMVDWETHSATYSFKVDPGWHYVTSSLQGDALGVVPFWGGVLRIGQLRYVTIREVETGQNNELIVSGLCPVNIAVADPNGRVITKDTSSIPSAYYIEPDIDLDGDLDDQIYIPDALEGTYSISVVPDSTTDTTKTFSIIISYEGESFILARDVPLADIPDQPYKVFASTPSITATVDIDPDVLNIGSKGRWITCYIELPDGYDVENIDVATVFFERTISAAPRPSKVGDYDNDGITDLMVKFKRSRVANILETGEAVEVLVVGSVAGETFGGVDSIRVIDPSGGGGAMTGSETLIPPISFMQQNHPNPFSKGTFIQFGLAKNDYVKMDIYDAAGRLVRTLIDGEQPSGYHKTHWDGTDQLGRKVNTGIYFYRIEAGGFVQIRKMIICR